MAVRCSSSSPANVVHAATFSTSWLGAAGAEQHRGQSRLGEGEGERDVRGGDSPLVGQADNIGTETLGPVELG